MIPVYHDYHTQFFALTSIKLWDHHHDGDHCQHVIIRYGDLAVGAPYSGIDGVGTVFIFRGGRTGVREEPDQVDGIGIIIGINVIFIFVIIITLPYPTQVILGSSVRNHIRSFGFSLSGGVDLDSNEYDDNDGNRNE